MNIPIETKPALWGAVAGAIGIAIFGFNWGGWVTGSKAETNASTRVDAAVVAALAPVCVERFQRAADASTSLAALKTVESWSQGEYVEKGGWAGAAGAKSDAHTTGVARACATLLTTP